MMWLALTFGVVFLQLSLTLNTIKRPNGSIDFDRLLDHIEELEQNMTSQNSEIGKLRSDRSRLETRVKDLEKLVTDLQSKDLNGTAETTSMKHELNNTRAEMKSVTNLVRTLDSGMKNLSMECRLQANRTSSNTRDIVTNTKELQNLQTELEKLSNSSCCQKVNSMDARLKAVEAKNSVLESKLNQTDSNINDLKGNLEEKLDRLNNSLTTAVVSLQHDVFHQSASLHNFSRDIHSELMAIQAAVNDTVQGLYHDNKKVQNSHKQVVSLEHYLNGINKTILDLQLNVSQLLTGLTNTGNRGPEVCFQAYLFSNTLVLEPVIKSQTIKFEVMENNQGGGYDASTGEFTAPVSGTYLFWALVTKVGNEPMDVSLHHSGGYTIASADTKSAADTTLTMVGLYTMTVGEKVHVTVLKPGKLYANAYSSFGGVLLYKHLP